ncbi:MAG: hypothetical protein LBH19_11180 [Dysgonamonadaceae bacterium]|jgi:hypothetical protein|nr:hypothetical protein [Dysgonamonadaceae bacterium]
MKQFKKIMMFAAATALLFTACSKDDEPAAGSDGKAKIENLAVTPAANLKYGDVVVMSGSLSDGAGLRSFTVKISNATGDMYEKTQMLTGKTFNLNESLVIPLPPNATAGNLTVSLTVKNSGDQLTTEEVALNNVAVPVFEKLYLSLGSKIVELVKDGDVFVYEDLIPAKASGKIYVKSDKTGMFWGNLNSVVTTMADGDLTIGKDADANLKVTFNPVTFELTIADSEEQWTETNEPLYILGNIARDNSALDTEREVAKMQGYKSGNKRYWAWIPTDEWWGAINAGSFRFKKGGAEEYILYRNHTIVAEGSDDMTASFSTSVDGHVGIKVYYDGTKYTKVSVEEMDWDGNVLKSLDYLLDGALNVNGTPVPTAITFAGGALSLKEGTSYIFEGKVNLSNGADITALGANLATANADPDVFSGQGNTTWKVTGNTGEYIIRIDPFASTIYACLMGGYPAAIYMDGWSWAKFAGDPGVVWNPERRLSLQRKGDTNIYEGTFNYRGWGGDVNFWYGDYTDPDLSKKRFLLKNFNGITTGTSLTNMKVPVDGADSELNVNIKVSINLQDGFTFDAASEEAGPDGPVFVVTPANDKKFTVTFTKQ